MRRAWKIALGAAGAAALVFAVSWLAVDPHLDEAARYPGGVVLRDAAGRVLRVSLGPGDVDCRPYYVASTNDWIVKALVASEDRRFFRHWGVNLPSVARACVQNVTSLRRISGASTITMQAARLISPHPRSLAWKYVEAFRALQLEAHRDKLWIVSQYLNRAPFGSNLVGVEAAANGWFGKRARDLGLGEAALLAGMVQSPSRLRPDRHLDRALKRREYVLGRMLACGMIDARQYEGARATRPEIRRGPRPFAEPFFCDWAMRHVARDAEAARQGDVRTTLDADIQARANRIVETVAAGGRAAAAVVLRVETGAVLALACSGDYFSTVAGQVNVATAPRPAGSTLKPFLVARALDDGLVTPEEKLPDAPRAYRGYNPQNFDASYRGMVTTADALVLSLNLPFVHLLERVGVSRFGTTLRALGFANLEDADESYGLGMAIGNAHVTLVELVNAYACLARGGVAKPACALEVEVARQTPGMRVFSEGASRLVTEMLAGEARSAAALGHVADVRTSRFAWKTGTSAAYRDAWTVAWNPEYVVGVWCGHKAGGFGDTGVVGAEAAAPSAWQLARSLYPGENGPWFGAWPEEVVERQICAESGQPLGPDCPEAATARALRGHSSTTPCTLHVRGIDGEVARRGDAFVDAFRGAETKARKLAIQRPEDGAEFRLLPGLANQRVVCRVVGNVEGGRLWWFVDGCNVGETRGAQPFAWMPVPGAHRITCSSADGVSASVALTVVTE